MTTPQGQGEGAPRPLPAKPDLRHLKLQAKDLLRDGQAKSLSDAQFRLARSYGFASWPKLKAHVESLAEAGALKLAIDRNDLEKVKALMTRNPRLHNAPLGYNKNGPLTWVAECRGKTAALPVRLEMARWMIANGSDVHQGGDGPLMRAALSDGRIPMMELLVAHGANVNALWNGNYPIVCAPCETLAPLALKWLLEHGATLHLESSKYGSPLAMVVGTYCRGSKEKHECLEVFAAHGFDLPDTPCMAFHRGHTGLLERHLQRDPKLLERRFTEAEIYPPELGIKPGEGLHATPVNGTTLLHLAVEYDELEILEWALARGADANAKAGEHAPGFGGHTALFHAVVTMGRKDDAKAKLLLKHGADPGARASIRKQLRDVGEPEFEAPQEYRDVTPLGYALRFRAFAKDGFLKGWVSDPALEAIRAAGGKE